MSRLASLLLLALLSCTPAIPPAYDAPPPPPAQVESRPAVLAATAVAERVVLMSFDGLAADALARQSGLTSFEHLARTGATARVIPVDPTLTAPTHATILTGASPRRHGIVANAFHIPGTPPGATARGMQIDPDVETLVEAARRQGKRVGAVSFPSIDGTSARRRADFGLAWTMPLAEAKLVRLTRADFRPEWVPVTWSNPPQRRRSFSPIMRARLDWRVPGVVRAEFDVVAIDTSDDRRENYDAFFIESGDQEIDVDSRGWFAVTRQTSEGLAGAWSKLIETSASLDVTIYQGAMSRTNAYPESFRSMLDDEAGFWPGEPDDRLGIDVATFVEQMERLSDFFTRAQTAAIRRMDFDLLLLYQPIVDETMHQYLGRPDGERAIAAAFGAADRAVAAIGALLHPRRDALIVTGDHGFTVAEREVRLGRLLADHGFAPRWRAYTTGTFAQLYRSGAPDDTAELVKMLTSTAQFDRIETKSAGSHPNAGDVTAWGLPSVGLSPSDDAPGIIAVEPHGHHGALNTHRELHVAFFAAGAGISRGDVGAIPQTSIARFVAALLGIAPPAAAE